MKAWCKEGQPYKCKKWNYLGWSPHQYGGQMELVYACVEHQTRFIKTAPIPHKVLKMWDPNLI